MSVSKKCPNKLDRHSSRCGWGDLLNVENPPWQVCWPNGMKGKWSKMDHMCFFREAAVFILTLDIISWLPGPFSLSLQTFWFSDTEWHGTLQWAPAFPWILQICNTQTTGLHSSTLASVGGRCKSIKSILTCLCIWHLKLLQYWHRLTQTVCKNSRRLRLSYSDMLVFSPPDERSGIRILTELPTPSTVS